MEDFFYRVPKIELHCHLDGSITPKVIRKMYDLSSTPLNLTDEELKRKVSAPKKYQNLTEYLSCFPMVTAVLNTRTALKLALMDLMDQASKENVLYQEIRFSPKYLSSDGLSMEEVIESLVQAKSEIEDNYSISIGLIACCMRGHSEETNLEVVRLAKKYQKFGLVGIDLAGNEIKYPTKEYKKIFSYAETVGLSYTIHAGETGNIENVHYAIEFGAKRIGHGVALAKDRSMMKLAEEKEILLEMCPVCNIQTGASEDWGNYPTTLFDEMGVKYCFNTDNRTVSNTTMTREFTEIDKNKQKMSESEVKNQTLLAVDYLFITEAEKKNLRERIRTFYI
ncbi:adenosine deaminase [Enterococcus sp. BWT-B8]|uniref:adenosine deaminase n=1 Tax=Enterococcus sp. BWT-B8 TaxID=2885157 RepID=UPI001E329120|nr:adenosine deaminase [Enterococcus sp. BWT-B8]MCB5953307.1 adenosine deaminase [Enterococcus sp. BWT-B8]